MLIFIIPSSVFAIEPEIAVEPYGVGEWDLKGEQNINFSLSKEALSNNYIATDGETLK